ncbi:MAG TPA: hypothetical protein VN607_12150 [Gemmatimonadaceae bacterium]|nr:hypothetical protein [Gemmatimonadaceae bacterium]
MTQTPEFPTAFLGAMSIFMALYFLVMIVITILVIIALWRAMRAHEQIAANLAHVADALRSAKG